MQQHETPMTPDFPTDDFEEIQADTSKTAEEKNRESLERAMAQNPDKEPFDYDKFASLYWRQDVQGDIDGGESDAVQAGYNLDYYLSFPTAQTIEEYAQQRQERDSQAAS